MQCLFSLLDRHHVIVADKHYLHRCKTNDVLVVYTLSIELLYTSSRVTYAAVAANISIRRASVNIFKHTEKTVVNTATIPSRRSVLETKYNATMDEVGSKEETTVPSTSIKARR